jgi:cell wall assembly regulator SMI1
MTIRRIDVPQAETTPATTTVLQQPLTVEALDQLEACLMGSLARLRRDLGCSDNPGKLEYESWMQYLRPTVR